MPKVKLDGYKTTVKNILKKTEKQTREQKISAIMDTLIKKSTFNVSPILIEQEVDHSLSRLVQQAQALNLELPAYLKAVKKTVDEIKKEYETQANISLKGDLILSTIAHQEKISVSKEEIEKLAQAANIPANRHAELEPVVTRQKTVDFLLNL